MNSQIPLQMQHDYVACGLYYILPLLIFVVWIMAFADVINGEFRGKKDKYLWIALVALVSPIGIPLYYFVGRHKKRSGKE